MTINGVLFKSINDARAFFNCSASKIYYMLGECHRAGRSYYKARGK